ncbi:MAG TPA: selenide, water dikinase SelD [Bacteroidaceae bacterium]|nr:selenide, water dikinase SelD [Bacteroidaceae bacterium]
MKIYLDYNATTPIDREVAHTMEPYLREYFGNPSSSHSFGAEAKKAVEHARRQVAALVNCSPDEIIFTSGGSESNNFAIAGYAYAHAHEGRHIITSAIEHPSVTEVCRHLEKKGFRVTSLPVDEFGMIHPEDLEAAITPRTILISVMHANNEIGTIQPVSEISEIARKHHIAFHTDAAQSVGKYPVDVKEMGVDLLSVAGHKLYAPKGVGALYIRDGITLEKLIHGADHEQNKRAGTENVLEIAGLGKACEIALRDLEKNTVHMRTMRDRLHHNLQEKLAGIRLNGHPQQRLPNTLSLSFHKIEANILLNEMELKGIAASAGAACHTDSIDLSPVLTAIKLNTDYAMGTIRFSTGKYTTEDEIDRASEIIIDIVNNLRPFEGVQVQEAGIILQQVQLTKYTQGLGCACKLRPQELEKILKELPLSMDPNILIDTRNSDDAAVYRINETTALVQTVDFFTPVVDDPYDFGAIAAANALSDIYAMGAKPLFALNIVGFPSNRLPMYVLKDILKGAGDKAREAGITVLGGHTVDDPEPKYGMVVSGLAHPDRIWTNAGAEEGDAIILTKPVGTGILTTALKRGLVEQKTKTEVIRCMAELNKQSAEIIANYPVHACTDVTGFGLIGHLSELSLASKVDVALFADRIPVFDETKSFAAAGIVPGGTLNNLQFFSKYVTWDESLSEITKIILCDAQTSGGLLFTVPQNEKDRIITELINAGIRSAAHIGNCLKKGTGRIFAEKESRKSATQ